jgi:aspartyl/asparaginyl-tRNA synthetase
MCGVEVQTISVIFCVCRISLHLESVVDVEGKVTAAPEKITGCTQQEVELQVAKVMSEMSCDL